MALKIYKYIMVDRNNIKTTMFTNQRKLSGESVCNHLNRTRPDLNIRMTDKDYHYKSSRGSVDILIERVR